MDLAHQVEGFLEEDDGRVLPWLRSDGLPAALETSQVHFGMGDSALEVAVASSQATLSAADIRRAWKLRQANRAAPLLLVILRPSGGQARADLCGYLGDPFIVSNLPIDQARRVCLAALQEPDRHAATRTLDRLFSSLQDDLRTGVLNSGLFATHELRQGVPARTDWKQACASSTSILGLHGHELIAALGYEALARGSAALLLRTGQGNRAIAVLLDAGETFDRPGPRFGAASPVLHGLHLAAKENLPWLIVLRGSAVRLYPVSPDVGVGRKGQAETYLELDLALLTEDDAGLLTLLFSPDALAAGGSTDQILAASRNFAAELGARLRDRIYADVVPGLAMAVGRRTASATEEALTEAYHRTLLILFRLLFVAYAEDRGLLPLGRNARYDRHALKTLARDFTDDPNQVFDPAATSLWDGMTTLWEAIDEGNAGWGVPAYNGGLFASTTGATREGASLASLALTDVEFGPVLRSLVVDETAAGERGPVDFRTLSVREFGTIYEGLLESSLSVAAEDLGLDTAGSFVPVRGREGVVVAKGDVYFHNRSGQRKSTGSYFTKHFAVEHLLNAALEPALDRHLERLTRLLAQDDEAAASEAFFDFRVADLAMGSGHFLVAAIDRIEARLASWLTEHPLAAISDELNRLADKAREALGDEGGAREIEPSTLLRRQIARRCIYGLDLNLLAVELARLAMWIHTFVPGLPMSSLSHGLQQGNSLTGIARVSEVSTILDPRARFGQESLFLAEIETALEAARVRLQRVARTSEATKQEARDAEAAYALAMTEAAHAKALFDAATAVRLGLIGLPADAPAAVAAGQQPRVRQELHELQAAHFPYLFPEVFSRQNPGFDVLLGNPPWEEATVEEMKFWALRFPGLRSQSSAEQGRSIATLRIQRPDLVSEFELEVTHAERVRRALTSGAFPGMGTGDPDLYKAFVWRFWDLCRDGGLIAVVLPRSVFATKGSAEWRQAVLPRAQIDLVLTKNKDEWLFTDVNPGYSICLVSIAKGVQPAEIRLRGTYDNPQAFFAGVSSGGTALSVERLQAADPLLCVPALEDERGLTLFDVLLGHPALGDAARPDFQVVPASELHATKDGKIYFTGRVSDHPVYNHLNVGHFRFEPDVGAFNHADYNRVTTDLEQARQKLAKRVGSPFSLMPREWLRSEQNLPAAGPRIAIRDVVHASNARKVWAALVPARTLLTNKAPYLLFPRGGVEQQAYLLGCLGSSVCDWYGHLRVVLNLNYFILNAIPVPVFDPDDGRCSRIARIAATLAVPNASEGYGAWRDLRLAEKDLDRQGLVEELDALVSLIYGIPDELLPVIFEGRNPLRPPLEAVLRVRAATREGVRT